MDSLILCGKNLLFLFIKTRIIYSIVMSDRITTSRTNQPRQKSSSEVVLQCVSEQQNALSDTTKEA